MKYDFTVYVAGSPELTNNAADALFAAGCDDGSPGVCDGVFSIDFHREAGSLDEAVRTAIANVESAGHTVERVEIESDGVSMLREPATS
ncbi:MAG: hypothetical protein WBC44_20535 [Planctomycetaceae bacterium]